MSAREATQACLDAIEAGSDGGAFVYLDADAALARARDLDDHFTRDGPAGPLHGMPLAVKDLVDVAGMPTTYGTAAFGALARTRPLTPGEERLPNATADAPPARRLRCSGAVILGKTQVPEFGLSAYSDNLIAPPARTPLDPARTAGGSSGGQAAAVAAGMLPVATGSDGGGSIRIPAACCGLIGLKPTRGRVPSNSGLDAPSQLVTDGPIARTAADAALLYDVLVAASEDNAHHRAVTAPDGPVSSRPLRVGWSTASVFAPAYDITVSDWARTGLDDGLARLAAAGHDVQEADIWFPGWFAEQFFATWTTAVGAIPVPDEAESRLTPLARRFRRTALERSAVRYHRALEALRAFEHDVIAQFASYDIVATPALACPPPAVGWFWQGGAGRPGDNDPELDYQRQCQFTPWTAAINVAGLPAIVVPMAPVAGEAIPPAIHLIGRPGAERLLLDVAARIT